MNFGIDKQTGIPGFLDPVIQGLISYPQETEAVNRAVGCHYFPTFPLGPRLLR